MDRLEYIRKVLAKYYDGSSSAFEEQELIDYFRDSADIPTDLLQDKEIFAVFEKMQEPVDIPENMDRNIIERLDEAEKGDLKSRRVNLYSLLGMAATIVVILSVYLGFLKNNHAEEFSQYAVEDPEIAYQEAMKAMEFVSSKWKTGTGELKNMDYVNKGIKTLQPLKKVSSGSRELQLIGTVEKAKKIQRQ